jgi:serine/threonine-protein kinase
VEEKARRRKRDRPLGRSASWIGKGDATVAAVTSIVDIFGNCRVVEQIAQGPLTNVYLAIQEPLGRKVAVKALRSTIAPTSPFAAHLAREAELLATLSHDNILKLYDFVRTDVAMWLVLEYVDGFTLGDFLSKAQKISPNGAMALGIEIARALSHAHEHGIVHRDVKPANVLVARNGTVRLVDFGIAHDDRVPSSPEPLEAGSTFGTPAYMSPEQILGEPVDARTDVFSLGIVLYQMVAGVRPFEAPDTKTTAQSIRHDHPPPLRSYGGPIPRGVERIVLRSLEKLPGDRFASASELADAMEETLRESSAASTHELIRDELLRAKLIERGAGTGGIADAPPPAKVRPVRTSLWPTVWAFLGLLAFVGVGGAMIQNQERKSEDQTSTGKVGPLELLPPRPGYLRVVAHPWAEVTIDGQRIDVTPFARSIPLSPGTHYVTLKHPKAPDERRVVKVAPSETVMLDVTMGVHTAAASDAGAGAGAGAKAGAQSLSASDAIDAGPPTP